MILSLVPMSAFAASDNTITRVVTVGKDVNLASGLTSVNQIPVLRLENKDTTFGNDETFRLTLDNGAEWNAGILAAGVITTDSSYRITTTAIGWEVLPAANADSVEIKVDSIDDSTIQVQVKSTSNLPDGFRLLVPMNVTVAGSGEYKVTVERKDSAISSGSYTYAIVEGGATTATVSSAKTITRNVSPIANITIDETVKGTIDGAQKFRLRLPNDFEWVAATAKGINLDISNGLVASVDPAGSRDVEFNFTHVTPGAVRGTITIEGAVRATKDAKYGDVNVTITKLVGDISNASDLKVGTYKDFGITLGVEEVKEFLAGREDNDYRTETITIKESLAGSLFGGRVIDFKLSDGVELTSGSVIEVEEVNGSNTVLTGLNGLMGNGAKSNNSFEAVVSATSTKAAKFEITLPITISGTTRGDVTLTVKGAGIEEQTIVIAKAIAPLKIETKKTDVKIGVQKQAAPDILITEVEAGTLLQKNYLEVVFRNTSYGMNFDTAKFEVIEGDLVLDADLTKSTSGALRMYVKSESNKPSTIKISGIQMTLDRNVPEGPFDVDVKGYAVLQNSNYKDLATRVERISGYANVVTPAPGEMTSTSKFVIGSTTYKVLTNGVEVEKMMDVAPFIQGGRTFLPIRFAAETVGVNADNIIWNAEAKTVTILKGDRVVGLTIGSNVLTVNGTPIIMDTVAMIKDGRTVLPVRFVAQALGAIVTWDEATQTVTVTQ